MESLGHRGLSRSVPVSGGGKSDHELAMSPAGGKYECFVMCPIFMLCMYVLNRHYGEQTV